MKVRMFLLLALLIPTVTALEFYPSSIEITLDPEETACRRIFFNLDNPATVKDEWAENFSQLWSVTGFDKPAQYHQIEIEYPTSEIQVNESEIQFCVSGSKPGQYKGLLVFRQDQTGNSVVQFAIWIQLTITGLLEEEPPQNQTPSNNDQETGSSSSSSSSSRSRSSSSDNDRGDVSEQISNNPQNTEQLAFTPQQRPEDIVLEGSEDNAASPILFLVFIPTILAAIFLLVLILSKKSTSSKEE